MVAREWERCKEGIGIKRVVAEERSEWELKRGVRGSKRVGAE